MADYIRGYKMITPFTNKNAGMCQWGFAEKDRKAYFIKQLLTPKYPVERENLSERIIKSMTDAADKFYTSRSEFYKALWECRNGNIVAAEEFFREGAFFYVLTERMDGEFLSPSEAAFLTEEQKRVLLRSLAHSIMCFHGKKIVHSDLKLDNILLRKTPAGYCTAKVIDFEEGFFEDDVPEEIVGDQLYFAPEALLRNDEEDVPVTTKADIFALGLIFHQLWCGKLPEYDRTKFHYASEALLNDDRIIVSSELPPDIKALVERMLVFDQDERPTAVEIWETLYGPPITVKGEEPPKPAAEEHREEAPRAKAVFTVMTDDDL